MRCGRRTPQRVDRIAVDAPCAPEAVVLGKYFAALGFSALALSLTFPIWLTVNYLGDPDNGVILAGYLGSLMLAGGYLAIGGCVSACTRNQVIAFVVSVVVCFCSPFGRAAGH